MTSHVIFKEKKEICKTQFDTCFRVMTQFRQRTESYKARNKNFRDILKHSIESAVTDHVLQQKNYFCTKCSICWNENHKSIQMRFQCHERTFRALIDGFANNQPTLILANLLDTAKLQQHSRNQLQFWFEVLRIIQSLTQRHQRLLKRFHRL